MWGDAKFAKTNLGIPYKHFSKGFQNVPIQKLRGVFKIPPTTNYDLRYNINDLFGVTEIAAGNHVEIGPALADHIVEHVNM